MISEAGLADLRHKSADIPRDIQVTIHGRQVELKQLETAAGRFGNFGHMCPFIQAFKNPLNNQLASFKDDYNILLPSLKSWPWISVRKM